MKKKIGIIGAGPGGYVAAIRAAQLGADVTLIEKENVGGTCLNWGCIPSKIMKTTAEMLQTYKRAEEFGLTGADAVRVDVARVMARKRSLIQRLSEETLGLLARNKVRYVKGEARMTARNSLSVDLENGGTEKLTWDSLVLALGTSPASLPNLPNDGRRIISSNEALELTEVPESVVIVGGGVVGCEFAFILSALGAQVTVVEALSRLLPLRSVDEDCSKIISREMKKRRIGFMLNRVVAQVDEEEEKLKLKIGPSPWGRDLKPKDRIPVEMETEKVLACVGRRPNTDRIGLEVIGLDLDEKGFIKADEQMATRVSHVFAVGDVLGPDRIMLAHVASAEGIAAVENIMGGNKVVDYSAVPSAIFTMPEVACVGVTETQAKEQGMNYRADAVNVRSISKAHVLGEIAGQAKIISNAENGRVLGMHMVGAHATELIAEGTLAVKTACTVQDLAETIHAHPTLSEVVLETSYKALNRAIHG